MKHLLILIIFLVSCTTTPHYDKVIVGDSRVNFGYWEQFGICNHGVNGDSTLGVLGRLDSIISHDPEIVYLQVGRNDIAYCGYTVASTFYRYQQIINRLTGNGIKLVVFSTIPDDENNPEVNIKIAELNSLLYDYCLDNGVEYIDINSDLAPNGFLLYHVDGVHLDATGYELWYKSIS